MLEIARYESERRLSGAVVVAGGLAAFAALFIAITPEIIGEVDYEAMLEDLPPAFSSAFGLESFDSLAGILAGEFYTLGWVLLMGLYMAYSAGSTIAGDVERDRMDMLLSNPVSRSSVVLEKYLSLLVPIVVVNVVVGAVIYVGARLVDDPIPLFDVIAVHALSVPYLLCCAAIGLLASAGMKREGSAQRASMGVVFSLYMVEALVTGTDFDWLGIASPSRYFDTNDILVEGTYDLVGAAILLEASALLLVASLLVFQRRDI